MVGSDGELNSKPVISMEPFKLFWIVNLLLPVLSFVGVESTVYRAYELVPHIKLEGTDQIFIGEFASYSRLESTPESQSTYLPLVFVNDGFGCPGNDTDSQPLSNSILLLRLTQECTDYQQAIAAQRLGVQGLIFYYTPDAVDKSLGSRYAERLSDITVVALELGESDIEDMANSPHARIEPFYRKSFFKTSHTFYFVVFAFCILMLLSCLWCILSYIRRCQYNVRNRRRRVGTRNLSYICVPTPAMLYVNKADPTVHGDNHDDDIINLRCGDKYVTPCKLNLHPTYAKGP